MAITYDNISYSEIELVLRSIISKEFSNVYIGSTFKMVGNECIRIELINSTLLLQTGALEQREYGLSVRYYHKADLNQELINKAVKGKIDRLRKHLLDNQVNSDKNWTELRVEEITYNVQDEENEEQDNLNIAEYELSIVHNNVYS